VRFFSVLFLLISFNATAQYSILSNKELLIKIEHGLDSIYNFQFQYADELSKEIEQQYPDHPLPQLFESIVIYWRHFPVTPDGPYHQKYVTHITEAINRSEKILDKDNDNTVGIFLNLMSRLLVMQYYADNHQSSKVAPYVRRAYKMTKKGFDLGHKMNDFLFSTGLYNYYREAYPERYPVYKPIAYFFPKGNKKLGLKQLENNWDNGIFLDAESLSFLVYISLNFEGNFKKSARYTKELHQSYPNNPLYLCYRIRSLLLLERYQRALPLIDELTNKYNKHRFFEVMGYVYEGVYEEKKNKDYRKAEHLYLKAIKLSEPFQPFINDRLSYAYFGLSRIWTHKDEQKADLYREKALELSSSSNITFD